MGPENWVVLQDFNNKIWVVSEKNLERAEKKQFRILGIEICFLSYDLVHGFCGFREESTGIDVEVCPKEILRFWKMGLGM